VVQFPNAVSHGNALVAAIRLGNNAASATVTDNNGNHWQRLDRRGDTGGGNGEDFELWYALGAQTSTARTTLTLASSISTTIRAVVAEFTGLHTSGAVDHHATAIGNGDSLSASASTTYANELVLGYGEVENTSPFTPSSSYRVVNAVPTGSGGKIALEYKVAPAAGTQTAGFSVTSQAWGMGIATLH
jgi:hypothetical protein